MNYYWVSNSLEENEEVIQHGEDDDDELMISLSSESKGCDLMMMQLLGDWTKGTHPFCDKTNTGEA